MEDHPSSTLQGLPTSPTWFEEEVEGVSWARASPAKLDPSKTPGMQAWSAAFSLEPEVPTLVNNLQWKPHGRTFPKRGKQVRLVLEKGKHGNS